MQGEQALVIGATPEATAAAAMLRRAGIPTETKWRGNLKRLLAKTRADIVVIASGEGLIVRDMILGEQRNATIDSLRNDLADAFDGWLVDGRDHECARTLQSEELCNAG